MRLEAIAHPTEIGPQLVTGNSDIVTRHRESFRSTPSSGHGPRANSISNPSSVTCHRSERTGWCPYGDDCIFAHKTGAKGHVVAATTLVGSTAAAVAATPRTKPP
ncbi:hypothetical protein Pmar_PMAR026696, partial [Perkinsus marinus ATCC 50983]